MNHWWHLVVKLKPYVIKFVTLSISEQVQTCYHHLFSFSQRPPISNSCPKSGHPEQFSNPFTNPHCFHIPVSISTPKHQIPTSFPHIRPCFPFKKRHWSLSRRRGAISSWDTSSTSSASTPNSSSASTRSVGSRLLSSASYSSWQGALGHHYETTKRYHSWDPYGKRLQTVLQMWENMVSHSETIFKWFLQMVGFLHLLVYRRVSANRTIPKIPVRFQQEIPNSTTILGDLSPFWMVKTMGLPRHFRL